VIGIDAYLVEVEVDISSGLPWFATVGLPEASVKESKERVRTAINNSGYRFPDDRITVNLAPANIKKEGTGFDLPMALGILGATRLIDQDIMSNYLIMGELSLDGRVKPVKGTLPMAIAAKAAGYSGIIVPYENGREASVVEGISVLPAKTLGQLIDFFRGFTDIGPEQTDIDSIFKYTTRHEADFSEVMGQEHVKRALEVAAAGGHNLIMIGPPGSGKTMLAKRIPSILPPITFDEAIETTKIFIPRPGEVSLAHNGVLFLDELSEFKKHVLEVLRQPLEDLKVTISRATTTITYPSSFMLIAAMNPCPCGYYGDPTHECKCSPQHISRYRSRISGPLMDRIDIHVEVPAVPYKDLIAKAASESSEKIRERVSAARLIQSRRFTEAKIYSNAQMRSRHIRIYCGIDEASAKLLEMAIDKLGLSARAYNRILKIARTIADLDGQADIQVNHISEAVQYRNLDRGSRNLP